MSREPGTDPGVPAGGRLLEPGDRIGPYRVGTMLGSGGMGQVFLAQDERSGIDVALKLLHPRWAGDDWLVELFHKEAELVRSLSHPNLVALIDVGADRDLHYLCFEFIHGVPLENLLRDGPLDPGLASSIIQDVAFGLAAAHGAGVVHRDVKPANVMITPDDRIKLIDFGVADKTGGQVGADAEDAPVMAGPGTTGVCGTRVYAAPEQNQGRPASPAADVYSLGLVAYELFSGARLFPDGEMSEVLRRQAALQTALDRGAVIHPRMPPPMARVVTKMLQLIPKDRYRSAVDMLGDIEAAINEMGGIGREQLAQSKRAALMDLVDSLLLKAQSALVDGALEDAAEAFARALALNPPNREGLIKKIRVEVQRLFWRTDPEGKIPVRLLDMLDELELQDLRILVEYRLGNSIRGGPREVLTVLDRYLKRWPRSVPMLRSARAAAKALDDPRQVKYLEKLADALIDLGQPGAAIRAFEEARALGDAKAPQSPREVEARKRFDDEVRIASAFHMTADAVHGAPEAAVRAEAWEEFLRIHGSYRPAVMEAARAQAEAGNRIRSAELANQLGHSAFLAGAQHESRRWLLGAVDMDSDRDQALLYLAEMTGGIPAGTSVRNQRVALLRRLGLAKAALYQREKELTGGERDGPILEEMADIAAEWKLDPTPYLVRRARMDLDAGRDDGARDWLLQAMRRSPNPGETAGRILIIPGVIRALGPAALEEIKERAAAEPIPGPRTPPRPTPFGQ